MVAVRKWWPSAKTLDFVWVVFYKDAVPTALVHGWLTRKKQAGLVGSMGSITWSVRPLPIKLVTTIQFDVARFESPQIVYFPPVVVAKLKLKFVPDNCGDRIRSDKGAEMTLNVPFVGFQFHARPAFSGGRLNFPNVPE